MHHLSTCQPADTASQVWCVTLHNLAIAVAIFHGRDPRQLSLGLLGLPRLVYEQVQFWSTQSRTPPGVMEGRGCWKMGCTASAETPIVVDDGIELLPLPSESLLLQLPPVEDVTAIPVFTHLPDGGRTHVQQLADRDIGGCEPVRAFATKKAPPPKQAIQICSHPAATLQPWCGRLSARASMA
jgi:hypothetical protein